MKAKSNTKSTTATCNPIAHNFAAIETTPNSFTPPKGTVKRDFLMYCTRCGEVRAI
jgi:hypothetical protein